MFKLKKYYLITGIVAISVLSILGGFKYNKNVVIDKNLDIVGARTSNFLKTTGNILTPIRNNLDLAIDGLSTSTGDLYVDVSANHTYINDNLTVSGTTTSGYFVGDGSGLTNVGGGLSATAFSATAPLTLATTSTTVEYGINQSGVASDGYLSSTDWTTFNNKWDGLDDMALATGNVYVGNSSNNPVATSTIFIDSNGNVLVGTTTQEYSEKLGIEGDIFIDGIGTSTEFNVTGKKLTVDGDRIYHGVGFLTDGMAEDKQDISLRTDSGDVYLDVEKTGGGDVEYIWDELEYELDCTTGGGTGGKATIQLEEGTAIAPVRNYIYAVPSGSTAILNASTTLPDGDGGFTWVGIAVIQSDTQVDSDGGLLFQRTNETLKHDGRGKVSEIAEKIRFMGPEYSNGIDQTLTISASSTARDPVVLTTNIGQVYQLHRKDWSAYDVSTDGIFVANAGGAGALTKYQKITDLNQAFEITDGTTISNNQRYVLTIWCAMNSANQQKCFVNLPIGTYSNDSTALADSSNKAVTTIPAEFKTTGFLLAKVVLKYTSTSNGTIANLSGGTAVQDLRGLQAGYNLGGAGVSNVSNFDDSLFTIFDNGDATKNIAFQASGISVGTTRTLTVQNSNGTLAYINNQTFTGTTVTTNLTTSATTTFSTVGYNWPDTDGANGTVLSTDSNGQLSWSAAGVGDITSVWNVTSGAVDSPVLTSSHSLNAGSADFLVIPNNDDVATSGSITIDTTSDQVQYYGASKHVLSPILTSCYSFASSSDIISGLIRGLGAKGNGITVLSQNAKVQDGTTLVMNLSDGNNDMDSITASSTRNNISVSTNTTWNAYEDIEIQFGTNTGGVTNGDYCINYKVTAN